LPITAGDQTSGDQTS